MYVEYVARHKVLTGHLQHHQHSTYRGTANYCSSLVYVLGIIAVFTGELGTTRIASVLR